MLFRSPGDGLQESAKRREEKCFEVGSESGSDEDDPVTPYHPSCSWTSVDEAEQTLQKLKNEKAVAAFHDVVRWFAEDDPNWA